MPDDVQAIAQRILDRMVEQGEPGLQIAVWHRGRQVVDAWAGAPGRNIDGRSLFPIFSTGKGVQATLIHRLVERGVLDLDAPIARWWPEFAAHGKQAISLRQVLNHTAGMAMMPEQGTGADVADWDGMCRQLAAMPPFPTPGSARFYHGITYAWLLGEPARRATGRDCARLIREEIAEPLGLDSLFFGLPDSELPRTQAAEKAPPPPPAPPAAPVPPPPAPGSPAAIVPARAIPSWVCPLEDWINTPAVRRSCVPASTGFANARSIARHYAALVGDGVDGVRLVGDSVRDAALRDPPLAGETRGRGLGWTMMGPDDDPGAVFGHGGYGGSTGWADRRHALAVGFTRSRMGGIGSEELISAIRRCLGCA